MSDHDKKPKGATKTPRSDRDQEQSDNEEEQEPSRDRDEGGEKAKKSGDKNDQEKSSGPPKKVLIIAAIVFLVLVAGGVVYYLHARNYESTDDAFTTGHVHEISARVAGTVQAVLVKDNQAVRKGQVIVSLDQREFNLALERARAQIARAGAAILQAQAELDQRTAANAQVAAQLQKAQVDYDRATALFQKDIKAVAQSEVDADSAQLKNAQGAFAAAKANESAARAQQTVAEAGMANARTGLHDAELQFSYTNLTAPVDGFVARKTVETGRRIQPGQALMAVVERDVWIVANLKETQLSKVKIGQSVSIEIDAVPGHEFSGRVDSFQPGSGAIFSLLPPDNATGNFTKIVQRVPVKIVFDEESVRDFRNRIVPGLSAVPTIDLRPR